MASIAIVGEVLNSLGPEIPRRILGYPPCQVCGRRVKRPFAGTDGVWWLFGHARCVPGSYWMNGSDFERLDEVLDWAFHLTEKHSMGRYSWLEVVSYVRPQWHAAAKEIMDRFFSDAA